MWIATNKGWLSIVRHRDKEHTLLVRARNKNHIESIFEDAEVYEDADADYPYRADIDDVEVARIISLKVVNINYDNFKASVDDYHYHFALVGVWQEMYDYGESYRPYKTPSYEWQNK